MTSCFKVTFPLYPNINLSSFRNSAKDIDRQWRWLPRNLVIWSRVWVDNKLCDIQRTRPLSHLLHRLKAPPLYSCRRRSPSSVAEVNCRRPSFYFVLSGCRSSVGPVSGAILHVVLRLTDAC